MSDKNGWIGVDLDGTLAEYHGWVSEEHIGNPIPKMLERVKLWLSEGKDVRIFTARVDGGEVAISMGNEAGHKFKDVERITRIVQDWCDIHIGVRLPVTCKKDYGMIELWDDRAKQVIPNTGEAVEERTPSIAEIAKQRGISERQVAISIFESCGFERVIEGNQSWLKKQIGNQTYVCGVDYEKVTAEGPNKNEFTLPYTAITPALIKAVCGGEL